MSPQHTVTERKETIKPLKIVCPGEDAQAP